MEATHRPSVLREFAVALYGSDGVSPACLRLQERHAVDVNVVLFAAFAGAAARRTLTPDDVTLVRRQVSRWHSEVVLPLREVRRRLKVGPPPAPNEATAQLRAAVQQSEINAELIELDELARFTADIGTESVAAEPVDRAFAATTTAIRTYGDPDTSDLRDAKVIATAAAVLTEPR